MEARGEFTITKNALVPADERAREMFDKLKIGDRVLVKVHRPRYVEHHRLAWKLFTTVAEAKGVSPETVLTWLKVGTGRVDFVQMPNGKVVAAPQSISFASMDQEDFQRFWNDALVLICENLLPDLDPATFDEARRLIAGDKEAAA